MSADHADPGKRAQTPTAPRRQIASQRRSTRIEVDGWINLDKPAGLTSTQAVGRLKFLFNARKAGHAGTLDPLASGVLPVAFGEATKTVPVVQDGVKAYRFRVRWGEERATDDVDGAVTARSDARPTRAEIEAALPQFVGFIHQIPPTFSAIKIDGARAYDLAREGESFAIAARPILVYRLGLIEAEAERATLEAECGKGAYVRAIARDLGRALGCYGHVVELRRNRVGPFSAETAVPLDRLPDDAELMARAMLPLEAGLAELPFVPVDRDGAAQIRRGQPLILRGGLPPEGPAWTACFGAPVALGVIERGCFTPRRVFTSRG